MSCEANGRRSFLRQSGCGLLTLAMLGLPDGAVALPISGVSGTSSDTERRYAIPQADGVSIDRRAQIILVRFANKVYAMALACPHENAAVKWLAKDRRFQCSKHDSRYTPEGTYTSGHKPETSTASPFGGRRPRSLSPPIASSDRIRIFPRGRRRSSHSDCFAARFSPYKGWQLFHAQKLQKRVDSIGRLSSTRRRRVSLLVVGSGCITSKGLDDEKTGFHRSCRSVGSHSHAVGPGSHRSPHLDCIPR